MTNQGDLQGSIRAITSTELDYNGDWQALFDLEGIAAGEFNGRLIGYLQTALGSSETDLDALKQAYATSRGFYNWNSIDSVLPLVNPILLTLDPVDGATVVAVNTNIVFTFNEDVQANAGNIVLDDQTGSDDRNIAIGDAQVTFSGDEVTLNLTTDLNNASVYEITIASGVIEDLESNPFTGISAGEYSFTTIGTAPTLSSNDPLDNATAVDPYTDIVLTFDKNVIAGTGNIIITDTDTGTDTRTIPIGDSQVSISTTTVTVNPTTDFLNETNYDVTIASGVILETFGAPYAGLTTGQFNFTTGGAAENSHDFERSLSENLEMSDANFGAFDLNKFAISTWVKRESTSGSETHTIMAQQGAGGTDISFLLRFVNDQLDFLTTTNGFSVNGRLLTNATYTSTSDWYHILVYFDVNNGTSGDRMRMFVDGTEVTSFSSDTTPTTAVRDSNGLMKIGNNGPANAAYDGLLYSHAFFSGTLPDVSTLRDSSTGLPLNIKGLTGLYSLPDADVSATNDYVLATAWSNVNTVTISSTIPT